MFLLRINETVAVSCVIIMYDVIIKNKLVCSCLLCYNYVMRLLRISESVAVSCVTVMCDVLIKDK